jgi:hypothetical protein
MTVFVSLTDGHGETGVEMRLLKDEAAPAQKVLFRFQGKVRFNSPLDVVDLTMDLRNIPIPDAGTYSVQIWANDQQVGERRIAAKAAQPREDKQ